MPELVGSTNPRTALAAIAASMAEPPFLRISMAVRVARGCAVPAAPLQPMAADRLAKLAPAMRSPAWTSGRAEFLGPAGWELCRVFNAGAAVLPEGVEETHPGNGPAARFARWSW